jgi:hypothetical protein
MTVTATPAHNNTAGGPEDTDMEGSNSGVGQALQRLPVRDLCQQRASSRRRRTRAHTHLLRRLSERGYRQTFTGITQPNEASNDFHRSFGFQDAGLHRRAAWKYNSWHDVAWLQLDLCGANPEGPPGPIR